MPRISITEPGKESQPYRFDLKRMQVTIGRSSANDISISHRSVSKTHCIIERRKGGYMVFDNGSTNGIKYRGERCSDLTLTNGMEFEIGDVPAVFTLTDAFELLTLSSVTQTYSFPVLKPSSVDRDKCHFFPEFPPHSCLRTLP